MINVVDVIFPSINLTLNMSSFITI